MYMFGTKCFVYTSEPHISQNLGVENCDSFLIFSIKHYLCVARHCLNLEWSGLEFNGFGSNMLCFDHRFGMALLQERIRSL